MAVLEDVAPGRGPHWAAAHPAPVVLLVARLQAAEGALQALSAPCAAALARCRAHWLDAQVDDVQEAAMDLGVRRVPCLFAMRADGATSAFDVKDWAGATQFAVAGLPALPQGTVPEVPEVPEVLEVPEVVEASHGTPSTQASGAGPVQVPGASGGAVVVSTPYGYQQVSAPSASVPVPVPVPAPVRPGEVEVEVVVVKKAEEEEVEEAVAGAAGRGWGPAGPFPWAFVETHGAAPEHSCPVVLVPESSSLLRKLTLVAQHKWLVLAYCLAAGTIVYNIVEGIVSVTLATEEAWDGDFSLLGFGVDSFVEVFSALFAVAKLRTLQRASVPGTGGSPTTSCRLKDRHALFAIAGALLVLAASSCAGGLFKLITHVDHSSSVPGIVVSAVSISGMLFLWYFKSLCAVQLNSAVLEADAACSLSCIVLSVALLVSSILRTASAQLWWVDGVSAIVLGALIGREGVHTTKAGWQGGDGACGCENSSSLVIKRLYNKLRTGNGDLRSCVEAASAIMDDTSLSRSGGTPKTWGPSSGSSVASACGGHVAGGGGGGGGPGAPAAHADSGLPGASSRLPAGASGPGGGAPDPSLSSLVAALPALQHLVRLGVPTGTCVALARRLQGLSVDSGAPSVDMDALQAAVEAAAVERASSVARGAGRAGAGPPGSAPSSVPAASRGG